MPGIGITVISNVPEMLVESNSDHPLTVTYVSFFESGLSSKAITGCLISFRCVIFVEPSLYFMPDTSWIIIPVVSKHSPS